MRIQQVLSENTARAMQEYKECYLRIQRVLCENTVSDLLEYGSGL